MDKFQKKIANLLDEAGAKVARRNKHIVYELENGRMFVMSSTPSDINSYKRAYSDLRRTAAIHRSEERLRDSFTPEAVPTGAKARFRLPIRDQIAGKETGIILTRVGGSSVQLPSELQPNFQFESVSELVSVADDVDSFWNLSADGRTRVLKKLAERFAKADVIGTRSHLTSFRGFEWFMLNAHRHDPLLALWGFDWQMPLTRSLRVKTPDGQVQIIETESKRFLQGTAQIAVILLRSDADMDEQVEIQTVGDELDPELNKYVFHHFIRAPKMRMRNLEFSTSQEWQDPYVVRPVVSEMLAVLSERRRLQVG